MLEGYDGLEVAKSSIRSNRNNYTNIPFWSRFFLAYLASCVGKRGKQSGKCR
jgi:hypothetical protein